LLRPDAYVGLANESGSPEVVRRYFASRGISVCFIVAAPKALWQPKAARRQTFGRRAGTLFPLPRLASANGGPVRRQALPRSGGSYEVGGDLKRDRRGGDARVGFNMILPLGGVADTLCDLAGVASAIVFLGLAEGSIADAHADVTPFDVAP